MTLIMLPPRHRIVTPEAKKEERARKKLSASQLEMFGDCKRKWAFRHIDKIEKAPDKSAQLGTRIHSILEDWLRDGLPPNPQETMILPKAGAPFTYYPGRVALAGIHHLPPPRIGVVERELSLTTPEADWTGRGVLMSLFPTMPVRVSDVLYRAHVTEILSRFPDATQVAVSRFTRAEVLGLYLEASLRHPLSHHDTLVYETLFREVFPEAGARLLEDGDSYSERTMAEVRRTIAERLMDESPERRAA